MPAAKQPKWGRVWRYQGTRGVVWRIRYQDATGRRVLETLGKEPAWTRQLAERELRRRLVDVEREGYRKPEKLTFAAFATRWLEEYLPGRGLKLTTTDNYRQTITRHLSPAFGRLPLERLEREPELIDRYITNKTRAGLSPKTITNHLLLLQVMVKTAIRWRLIRHNPIADIQRPRVHQPDLNVLTETEIARLWTAYTQLEADEADPEQQEWWRLARTLTFTALGTAMRRGELLALRWKDIHLLEAHLHVREALVKGRFTTPKSRAGKRRIDLGPRTTQHLADHRQTTPNKSHDHHHNRHDPPRGPTTSGRGHEYLVFGHGS